MDLKRGTLFEHYWLELSVGHRSVYFNCNFSRT